MDSLAEVLAALTLTVAAAAMSQFGVKVRCHAPARPSVQQVLRTPGRAAQESRLSQARRFA